MRGVTRVDVVVAVGFVLAAVAETVVTRHESPGLLAFQASGAIWLGSLAVRRRRPLVTISVIAAAATFSTVVTHLVWPDTPDGGGVWIIAMMLAAYSVGAHAAGRAVVLGVLMPMAVVMAADSTTRSGWSRISGVLFVTVFVGLLPTVVGRLVRIRRIRLEALHDQQERIVRESRTRQEAAALAERLRATEQLQPTLLDGLQELSVAAESGRDPGEVETSARVLLARTREEVVALTAPIAYSSEPAVPSADHVRVLRSSAQPWVVLAAGAIAAGLVAETVGALSPSARAWTLIPAAVLVAVPLAFSWWRPVPAIALGYVAAAAYSWIVAPLDGSLSESALALASAFAVAALSSSRRTAVIGLVVCLVGQLVGVRSSDPASVAVVLLLCWLGGLAVNEVSRLVEQTRVNNEVLNQHSATFAARAVVEERLRLARELHDAIGHCLTVVALQSGAARRLAATDPARAAEVMRTVSTAARDGVVALTAEGPTAGVSALVERIRGTGLEIDADLTDEELLEPSQRAIAYRVVQEALTNVLRHAPGAHVSVVVRRRAEAVEIIVTNSAGSTPGSGSGTGVGLRGIHDRVTAAGGAASWSAREDGGFEVRAVLPISAQVVAAP